MHPSSQSRTHLAQQNPYMQMGLVLAGAAICAAFLFWFISESSALLFLGRWPPLSAQDTKTALANLHLQDPRTSWPKPLWAQLAGPIQWYVTAGLLFATVIASGVFILRFRTPGGYSKTWRKRSKGAPPARWAKPGQLKPLRVREPVAGRLTLGRAGGLRHRFFAAEPCHSVLCFGPPGSGKTVSLAIPALLEWNGPALATAVKADLLQATMHRRKSMGRVFVFDPTGQTGLPQASWNPLQVCESFAGAKRQAKRLVDSVKQGQITGDAKHWYTEAERYLAVLLLAAARARHSIAEVVRWVDTDEREALTQALDAAIDATSGEDKRELENARQTLLGFYKLEARVYSSVRTTASEVLDPYSDPRVAGCTIRNDQSPQIESETLLNGEANTVYLIAPPKEQRDLGPVFAALASEMVDSIYERSVQNNGALDPPFLLDLDDAATLAPIPHLEEIAVTGRGVGIQLVSIWHDQAQIARRYAEAAGTLVNAHRARMLLTGIADVATLDYASKLLGQEEVSRTSLAHGSEGRTQATEAQHHQPLAPAHAIRQTDDDRALLVYGNLPPTLLRLRRYFEDKRLAALANNASPAEGNERVRPDTRRFVGKALHTGSDRLRRPRL
jgi:type IV secretion system protein VirD4